MPFRLCARCVCVTGTTTDFGDASDVKCEFLLLVWLIISLIGSFANLYEFFLTTRLMVSQWVELWIVKVVLRYERREFNLVAAIWFAL